MDAAELEDALAKKQEALAKIEHAVAQTHLDPPKVRVDYMYQIRLFCYFFIYWRSPRGLDYCFPKTDLLYS